MQQSEVGYCAMERSIYETKFKWKEISYQCEESFGYGYVYGADAWHGTDAGEGDRGD